MFTKIDIKKFGLYKDFTWGSLPELSRVNIIYGRNYSGKTTLSRIFDSILLGQLHKDYLDGQFELVDDTGKMIHGGDGAITKDAGLDLQVRVYNSDYVRRNLGWLNNEEAGEIRSFTLLGSGNVEAQKAIDEIDEKLGSIEEKKGLLYADYVATESYKAKKAKHDELAGNLEWQLKNKANGDIKKKNDFVKQGTNYIVNNIKRDIDEFVTVEQVTADENGQKIEKPRIVYTIDHSVKLTDKAKERLRKTVSETEKPTINALPEGEPHLSGYEKQVVEFVTKKITLTKTLQELVENDLLQDWVDRGREVNRDRKHCAFCGNPISEERWEEINAHFSKESEEMKNSLAELKRNLEQAALKMNGFLESKGLIKENIYAAFLVEYEKVMGGWNAYVEQYKKAVEKLIVLIDERLANIFKPIACDYEAFTLELTPILKALNALVEKNNEYGLQLDKAKEDARNKLRLDYVHQFCVDINYTELMEKLAKEEVELKEMENASLFRAFDIGELRKLRKQKELEKKDEGKAAQKVTELLVKHFGNGSLSLEPETVIGPIIVGDAEESEKPRTKFVVKRGGEYAKNLSEGEKSLISFCYFIAQMDDELKGPDAGKLVVFIDDPISSLDSSHIFFMYSLIDTVIAAPKKYGQLFISTHNLEFLKFLKRLKLPGSVNNKSVEHYVVEKQRKGDSEYKCVIKMMPDYLRDYVTEYNFLFQQVYEIARPISGKKEEMYKHIYSQYYNAGNNMRKFLECYLFYRFPDSHEPTVDHLDDLFEGNERSEVNRVINEYSHLAWAERGLKVIDVPEIEKAAKFIMKALKANDPSHFKVLCKSVNVDDTVDFG